jgi:hypothetical protein
MIQTFIIDLGAKLETYLNIVIFNMHSLRIEIQNLQDAAFQPT